jgi:hypothetical protein
MNAIVQGQTEMAHTLSRKMVENASNDITSIRASSLAGRSGKR